MKTADYLAKLKQAAPRPSVYAVAQLLDLKEDHVRSWHLGRSFPDDYACARIAETLDLPLEQVIADVNAEREKDPAKRNYWEGLSRKFAACVVAGLATTMFPSDARSVTVPPVQSGATNTRTDLNLYKLCDNGLRRLLQFVGRGFGRFPGHVVAS